MSSLFALRLTGRHLTRSAPRSWCGATLIPARRVPPTPAIASVLIRSGLASSACRRCASSFSAPPPEDPLGSALLDLVTYEAVCTDTLESLCEYFDRLVEGAPHLKNADITFSDGVLTIHFGATHGTYVINRQSPNRQIWLSSPTSGPKRYDYVPVVVAAQQSPTAGSWIYKHDRRTLHQLLDEEIAPIVRGPVDFRALPFGGSGSS